MKTRKHAHCVTVGSNQARLSKRANIIATEGGQKIKKNLKAQIPTPPRQRRDNAETDKLSRIRETQI